MKTNEKYSRFSKIYDFIESKMHMKIYKKEVISMLSGKTLELGIGSGANLKFFPHNLDITGIDFSPGMLKIAEDKATKLGLTNLKLIEMDIENMSFPIILLIQFFQLVYSAPFLIHKKGYKRFIEF